MKVIHVITGLNSGGAETALCRLLESSREREIQQLVVALGNEGALSGRVRQTGAGLLHMNVVPTRPNPLWIMRLRKLLCEEKPHLIQGWMYHANLAASIAALGRGTPVFWGVRHSLHDLATDKWLTRAVIRFGVRMSRLPEIIVYNSKESARQHEALGYRSEATRIIPNGFDTEVFKPDPQARSRIRAELDISPDAFVIGQVARWHPTKDHETLIRAAALHLRAFPETVFVLVGKGVDNSNERLTFLTRSLGMESSVRLCGHRSDIPQVTTAFDVANLSSRGESFPNAVGEAMACGVPCVATEVGGVRDVIGRFGMIVEAGNAEAMSAGWREVVQMSRGARLALGRGARTRILENYSLKACTDAYLKLYEGTCGGVGTRTR